VRPVDPAEIRRIVIRVNNWIGDVVMISPAMRAIRAHFREARIAILAKRWVLETLRGDPFYDDLIEYDNAGTHRGIAGRLRLAAALRRERFDLAILFQKAFDAAALALLGGARFRIGYATDARSWLLTHPLKPPPSETHHVEVFLGIARALGCPIIDALPSFHLSAGDRAEAGSLLDAAGFSGLRPLVTLHPGASKEPRAWHPDRFTDLGRRLAERNGARIILLGSTDERRLLERIAGGIPRDVVLLPAPGLRIKVAAAIVERCHLFVGNDSGPMHMAAALGVPTVAIFGPGTPRRTAPLASRGRIVSLTKDYPCSPCRQDFFRECPASPAGKPFCLEEIQIDEVERAAAGLLARAEGAAS